jgi:hypothetical protein
MAGLEISVSPRRRQVAVVDPETPVPESTPLTIDLESGSYFRPEREGRALVGGHFGDADPPADPDGFREQHDLDWAGETGRYFGPETRIRSGWAGLYAVTPDHSLILEETVPGFVQAVGFSGHGFQHAPATGRVVADLCPDGATGLVDLGASRGDRFGDSQDASDSESHVARTDDGVSRLHNAFARGRSSVSHAHRPTRRAQSPTSDAATGRLLFPRLTAADVARDLPVARFGNRGHGERNR